MNSKWSQYHKKKANIQSNKQTKTTERYISRKDKLRLLFLHIFHTSFTFRHKQRFTKSKMGKKTHWRNSSKIQQKNHRNRQNHSVHYNIFKMVVGYNLF
jgi:hypothetical protein